jgi:hypothetical protein
VTPLEMAVNAARAVERYAEFQTEQPLEAYVQRAGTQGHQAAALAQAMALVSIAKDVHRIANALTGGHDDDDEQEPER